MLPIGTQSFEVLRNSDSVYVDKTKHMHDLISNGRIYFLSRPRRFGKS
ncbi:MAG: AAA family ATPase, partial [Endomicrobium sp.]|nr:AAA family ATPase [Endomicrobium sp.]